MITFETKVVDAVVITSYYSNFKGNSSDWRDSYFELLSWHNTYYLDYEISLCGRGDNPFVRVVVRDNGSLPSRVVDLLSDLQYGEIKTYTIKIAIVEPSSGLEDPNIDGWYFE